MLASRSVSCFTPASWRVKAGARSRRSTCSRCSGPTCTHGDRARAGAIACAQTPAGSSHSSSQQQQSQGQPGIAALHSLADIQAGFEAAGCRGTAPGPGWLSTSQQAPQRTCASAISGVDAAASTWRVSCSACSAANNATDGQAARRAHAQSGTRAVEQVGTMQAGDRVPAGRKGQAGLVPGPP